MPAGSVGHEIQGLRLRGMKHSGDASFARVCDRPRRPAQLAGSARHVGIGSDLDLHGYDDMPPALQKAMIGSLKSSYAFREKLDTDGYDHPRRIYDLTEELLRRNYSKDNIKAILGGNFQRLLTATWGG